MIKSATRLLTSSESVSDTSSIINRRRLMPSDGEGRVDFAVLAAALPLAVPLAFGFGVVVAFLLFADLAFGFGFAFGLSSFLRRAISSFTWALVGLSASAA